MLIEATNKQNISSAARLVSFPQPAGQSICVSFWYHIFGNSIGMCLIWHNYAYRLIKTWYICKKKQLLLHNTFVECTCSIYILLLLGSLKFIVKHPDEPEVIVWMRSGTQGNKWRFADLTFNSDKPIQVFLFFLFCVCMSLVLDAGKIITRIVVEN